MYDVLVIGGGVIGCAIARELSRRSGRICVVERNEDVCTGTSKANSAIVHAGFDAEPGTRKARFNVEGSRMMEALSRQLDFPYRRCGALVLCLAPADREKLQALYQRGLANGVEGLEAWWRARPLHRMEPALSQQAVAALYAPTSAILWSLWPDHRLGGERCRQRHRVPLRYAGAAYPPGGGPLRGGDRLRPVGESCRGQRRRCMGRCSA